MHNYFAFLQNLCVICYLTLKQVQVQVSHQVHFIRSLLQFVARVFSWLHSAAGYHTCNSAATQCSATLPYQSGRHVLKIVSPVLTIYKFAELATYRSCYVASILDMPLSDSWLGNGMRMSCIQLRISQNAGSCLLFLIVVYIYLTDH